MISNVGEWAKIWLNDYAKPHIRPRTFEKYESCLKLYIIPKFGTVPLTELNARALQQHLNSLMIDGRRDGQSLSASTVRATRRYFCMCMDDAVKSGLVTQNIVRLTKPPKLTHKEIVVLAKEEVTKLVDEAKKIDHPFMSIMMPVLISLTAHTGLRQGEVFGLKWEDLDFDKSSLSVRRSLAHVIGKGAVFQEPKTKNSRRRLLLLGEDVVMLRQYKKWQEQYADELGDLFEHSDLVFTSSYGKPISPTNFSRRYFKPLVVACGIDENFTFHGLRHTHATLLLKQGVSPKIVQERLGHSSIKVTLDTYSHVVPDMQQQAVLALEEIFS